MAEPGSSPTRTVASPGGRPLLGRELRHARADLGAHARRHGLAIDHRCCHRGAGGYRWETAIIGPVIFRADRLDHVGFTARMWRTRRPVVGVGSTCAQVGVSQRGVVRSISVVWVVAVMLAAALGADSAHAQGPAGPATTASGPPGDQSKAGPKDGEDEPKAGKPKVTAPDDEAPAIATSDVEEPAAAKPGKAKDDDDGMAKPEKVKPAAATAQPEPPKPVKAKPAAGAGRLRRAGFEAETAAARLAAVAAPSEQALSHGTDRRARRSLDLAEAGEAARRRGPRRRQRHRQATGRRQETRCTSTRSSDSTPPRAPTPGSPATSTSTRSRTAPAGAGAGRRSCTSARRAHGVAHAPARPDHLRHRGRRPVPEARRPIGCTPSPPPACSLDARRGPLARRRAEPLHGPSRPQRGRRRPRCRLLGRQGQRRGVRRRARSERWPRARRVLSASGSARTRP